MLFAFLLGHLLDDACGKGVGVGEGEAAVKRGLDALSDDLTVIEVAE